MMVTFISQCEKKALNRTRRVLDAFANRIGDNSWQTVITDEGLLAVKKLLRKSASKNTAVACHWIRSRSRSELVWVVGNKNKFNHEGIVPVNSTQKNIVHTDWENSWQYATSIQIVAVLAALLHDIGKATFGFQNKLTQTSAVHYGDPYRHEWISLRLFQTMIANCDTDEAWLNRLANFAEFMQINPDWLTNMSNDASSKNTQSISGLPPLAQLISWLIVTHHRLPFYDTDIVDYCKAKSRKIAQNDTDYLESTISHLYEDIKPVSGWVKNQKSCDECVDTMSDFWSFKALPMHSKKWQNTISRWTKKALAHVPLMSLASEPISDPFILQLARLCLMVGDHNYSSIAPDDKKRLLGDPELKDQLIANTDFKTKQPKQALDEHLLGVGCFTARFARLLPQFSEQLPAIEQHKAFTKRTSNARFNWQNRAYDVAKSVCDDAQKQGFFGVNMASTGCGKTLGNARIMYALADEKRGARFTIALGLRVLTLQTGKALSERLGLDDASLAILVGGAANRTLFELNQTDKNRNESNDEFESVGSESLAELVDGLVFAGEAGIDPEELGTVVADPKAHDLLYAPIVTCTVDHMISASENTRGGKHISPILRLLTSDLVLDEPDDFDQSDLPALSRLVHLAGLFGSRVLLSSATLTPDLVTGLFSAYQAGRAIWNNNNALPQKPVVCAWFDEHHQTHQNCSDSHSFNTANEHFVTKRTRKLRNEVIRRKAEVLPVALSPAPEGQKLNCPELADIILSAAQNLHHQHHELCPQTGKSASVGLVRLANIRPLVDLMQALYTHTEIASNVQIHLCCYHAQQLLLLRNTLETKLDRILDRNTGRSIFEQPEINSKIKNSSKEHHLFIVLATPVAEVGRDHDYDWAIVEPSSMRSIIQLAGRVWRHRPEKIATSPNILIMDSNIKALKQGDNLGIGEAVFERPGYEAKPGFLLNSHRTSELISEDQLNQVDSIARIAKPDDLQATQQLADLEHAVMANLLNNSALNFVNAFWQQNTANRACVHLQRLSPFRLQERKQDDYVYLPDDNEQGFSFKYAEQAWKNLSAAASIDQTIRYTPLAADNPALQPWLTNTVSDALASLARQLNENDLTQLALRFATVKLEENQNGWCFHPWLGFWNS